MKSIKNFLFIVAIALLSFIKNFCSNIYFRLTSIYLLYSGLLAIYAIVILSVGSGIAFDVYFFSSVIYNTSYFNLSIMYPIIFFRLKINLNNKFFSTLPKINLELGNTPFVFNSLEIGYENIKFSLLGVAGVYKLINAQDSERFYIGSSVNLARRIQEYIYLTKGIRLPQSSSEVEISKTPSSKWILVILELTTPQLSLVLEQYALIKFKPTINKNIKVIPKINSQWSNLSIAIKKIIELLSLFDKNSFGYERFQKFLKVYTIAKDLKYDIEETNNKYYNNLVFVYDKDLPNKEPIVYSSINKVLKSLLISYGTLIEYISNKYIFKGKILFSFEPLCLKDFIFYSYKPTGDNQLRKNVFLFNEENELVFEFKSAREMARHFKIDAKLARTAIERGIYLNFKIVSKLVSFRKKIFVFDSKNLNLITEFKSLTLSMKFAKVSFYNMKKLLETNKVHNGKIYSYSKILKFL